jgi:hypothetical protein
MNKTGQSVSPGEITRALTLPAAAVIAFKYWLDDGKIEIIKVYPQDKPNITDNDIKNPTQKIVMAARERNVTTAPEHKFMVDYVIVNTNGTYACPFAAPGSDKSIYSQAKNASVFYDYSNVVSGPADAVTKAVLSPLAAALTVLGKTPKNYRQQISPERVKQFGTAVETIAMQQLNEKVTSSTSAAELMDIYKNYNNYSHAQVALQRAKKVDPAYVKSVEKSVKGEVAAMSKSRSDGVASDTDKAAYEATMGLINLLVKETVRGFSETYGSGPVVLAGDNIYVCGSKGLCPGRAIETQSGNVRVRYTSKDCEYHDEMDFSEYLHWIEDPVQWVAKGKVATQSDINSGRFRCDTH